MDVWRPRFFPVIQAISFQPKSTGITLEITLLISSRVVFSVSNSDISKGRRLSIAANAAPVINIARMKASPPFSFSFAMAHLLSYLLSVHPGKVQMSSVWIYFHHSLVTPPFIFIIP